jgi:hypothetical protein
MIDAHVGWLAMRWTCVGCGVDNDGGIFCIACGTRKSEAVPNTPDHNDMAGNSFREKPGVAPTVPWIVTAIVLVATVLFGGWQASLSAAAEESIRETTSELATARANYTEALDVASTADGTATTCYYASWCWASTYRSLLEDAQIANDIAATYGLEVSRLEGVLIDAQDELDRYSNAANVAWGVGGLGTVGSGVWAFITHSRRK